MILKNSSPINPARILALDYLRVIAVGILFFYHLGMIWVPDWEFHFKQDTNWFWLQYVMILSSPWRMGLLWFISGTSLYIMQQKKGVTFLLTSRSNAILLPLLFGLFFIVPVQLFVEMTQKGAINSTFWEFTFQFYFGPNNYFKDFSSGIWHHTDVNHLWFLRSLWRFTLVLIILQYFISHLRQYYGNFNFKWFAFLMVISVVTMNIDNSDLKRDIYGFTCLLFGYLFGVSEQFWNWLKSRFHLIIIFAVALILTYEIGFWLINQQFNEAELFHITQLAYNASKAVSMFAVLAIAHKVFIKPHPLISEANKYVFPLYVIHQSVLIIVAFLLVDLELSSTTSLMLTLVISIIICTILLIVCKYSEFTGLLLGKRPTTNSWFNTKLVQASITIVSLPLAMRLLGLT